MVKGTVARTATSVKTRHCLVFTLERPVTCRLQNSLCYNQLLASASAKPSTVAAILLRLNLCSGLVSKSMVVEICRKLPATSPVNAVYRLHSKAPSRRITLLKKMPSGAPTANISSQANAYLKLPSRSSSTDISAKAAGIGCMAMPISTE